MNVFCRGVRPGGRRKSWGIDSSQLCSREGGSVMIDMLYDERELIDNLLDLFMHILELIQ